MSPILKGMDRVLVFFERLASSQFSTQMLLDKHLRISVEDAVHTEKPEVYIKTFIEKGECPFLKQENSPFSLYDGILTLVLMANIPQCLNIMDVICRHPKLFMAHKHHRNRPNIIKM